MLLPNHWGANLITPLCRYSFERGGGLNYRRRLRNHFTDFNKIWHKSLLNFTLLKGSDTLSKGDNYEIMNRKIECFKTF